MDTKITSTSEVIKLETLSAIHIGSGTELLYGAEYFSKGGLAYIIDTNKLIDIVGDENIQKICEILSDAENKNRLNDVEREIKKLNPNKSLIDAASHSIKVSSFANNLTNCKTFIRDGMDKIYLPGSSIKGAIRTSLLALSVLNTDIPNSEKEIIELFRKYDNIEQPFFGMDPNHDAFRDLRITDAYSKNVLVSQICTLSRKKVKRDSNSKSNNITAEILPANSSAFFTITNRPIEYNYKKSIEKIVDDLFNIIVKKNTEKDKDFFVKLFRLLNSSTEYSINREIKQLKQPEFNNENSSIEYRDKLQKILNWVQHCGKYECIIRIGYGEGFTAITGGAWFLDDTHFDKKVFAEIGSTLMNNQDKKIENKYSALKKDIKNVHEPITRTIPSAYDIMGFVKLTLCSEKYVQLKKEEDAEMEKQQHIATLKGQLKTKLEQTDYEAALKIIEKLLDIEPDNLEFIKLKEKNIIQINEQKLICEINNLLEQAEKLVKTNNVQNAIDALELLNTIRQKRNFEDTIQKRIDEISNRAQDVINKSREPLSSKIKDSIMKFDTLAATIQNWQKKQDNSNQTLIPEEAHQKIHDRIKAFIAKPDKKDKKEIINYDGRIWQQIKVWIGEQLSKQWFDELVNNNHL